MKSVPNSSLASKPHSCHQMDSLRESAKIEPHMSPLVLHSYTSTRPFQPSTGAGEQTRQQPALIYDAWAVAKQCKCEEHSGLVIKAGDKVSGYCK